MQSVHEKGAASVLLQLLSILEGSEPQGSPALWRRRLTAWLTTRGTADIPPQAWPLLHEIWSCEAREKSSQRAADLPRLTSDGCWTDSLSLWRGDITRLQAGAIVNAANSGLTGCYVPFHVCVDNAIHTAAGPWLRQACEAIMAERGRPEPVATATVTDGFYLPARYVLHTVGPVVHGSAPSPEDRDALAGCYLACLAAALASSVDSIAFCAISTGVFGYPKRAAALASLGAIQGFLAGCSDAPHVILVAFSGDDEAVCRSAIEEMLA
jgi:O-acetyl-ADP-ribose deacetylase (regulator of RNase III)